MATIKEDYLSGGAGLHLGSSSQPALTTVLREIADDLTAIHAAFVALTAKLDADAGVTDADYNTLNPAALTHIKG